MAAPGKYTKSAGHIEKLPALNSKFTRIYVICYSLILFWGRTELWLFKERWSLFFLDGCMLEHPSLKGKSSTLPKRNLGEQVSVCDSLLQMALILFSKLLFVVH